MDHAHACTQHYPVCLLSVPQKGITTIWHTLVSLCSPIRSIDQTMRWLLTLCTYILKCELKATAQFWELLNLHTTVHLLPSTPAMWLCTLMRQRVTWCQLHCCDASNKFSRRQWMLQSVLDTCLLTDKLAADCYWSLQHSNTPALENVHSVVDYLECEGRLEHSWLLALRCFYFKHFCNASMKFLLSDLKSEHENCSTCFIILKHN